jgi:hypothetical protein
MRALLSHDIILVMDEHNNFHHQSTQKSSSKPFGKVPNVSEAFGTFPNHAEPVGSVPNLSEELERIEKYSLTVRDVARMFENAGVPRTERSIVKWCAPNQHGVPRLTCQYEPNERRWLITEESVRTAIAEEIARQRELEARNAQAADHPVTGGVDSERPAENAPQERTGERVFEEEASAAEKDKIIRELKYKLRTERIASQAKEMVINNMEKQHMHLFDQVAKWSRQVGVLETKLLAIEGSKERHEDAQSSRDSYRIVDVPNHSEQQEDSPEREGE